MGAAAGPLHSIEEACPAAPCPDPGYLQAWKTDALGCVCRAPFPRGRSAWGAAQPGPGPPAFLGRLRALQHPRPSSPLAGAHSQPGLAQTQLSPQKPHQKGLVEQQGHPGPGKVPTWSEEAEEPSSHMA